MQQTDDTARVGPSMYYLDPAASGRLAQWDEVFSAAAVMGFDHVVVPPLCTPAANGDMFRPSDLNTVNPAFSGVDDAPLVPALRDLARRAADHGITLVLDLVPDRLAAGGKTAHGAADLFIHAPPIAALDPRHGGVGLADAVAETGSPAAAARLAAWWTPHVAAWHESGIGGLRVLGLANMPGAGPLLGALRQAVPSMTLIGWTPGMAWRDLPSLIGSGVDFVCGSLAWWDWRGDWIWQELALLRRIAPVLACPEAPFDRRLAQLSHDPALREAAVRRALRLAAFVGDGWLIAAGLERGAIEPLGSREIDPPTLDFSAELRALNADLATRGGAAETSLLAGADGPVLALLREPARRELARREPDARGAAPAAVILANHSLTSHQTVDAAMLLPRAHAAAFTAVDDAECRLSAADSLDLAPGEVAVFAGAPMPAFAQKSAVDAQAAMQRPRVAIEAVTPSVEHGRFPAKALAGTVVDVEADLICDGHDQIAARVLWRDPGAEAWQDIPMRPLGNDRWTARIPLGAVGIVHFAVEAWKDGFASFRDELGKKFTAGVPIRLELIEGRAWLAGAAERGDAAITGLLPGFDAADADGQRVLLLAESTAALMRAADDRPGAARSADFPLRAERLAAAFASWYEVFPRSMSDDPARHGTFRDVIRHLPRVRDMGFDVLYFPPIHPIGQTNRKGRNNSLTPGPDDPGSPYAIGSAAGGHDALHPELGGIADFRALVAAAADHGLEIALDFAIQCSPDHPWLKQHKGWFDWRPDGTIRYAENPPKKYEDIVNVDFYAADAVPDLWLALRDIVLFWAGEGVRLFRVDNPHTKPLPFWEWLIADVQAQYPDALFLAEAFTRPKVMYRLGKIGFSQSYTYFTWRNTPAELRDYVTELTTTAPRDFFRPHFFVNTPDINPEFLHHSGRPGFVIRAVLAATLSGLWGVYNGFELCEGRPLAPGREDYLDSEKYQMRAWDWDRPGNIVGEITRLNRLRRSNPALQSHLGVRFLAGSNGLVLAYEKATEDRSNVLLVAVSFDPLQAQESAIELPLWRWGLPDDAVLQGTDLTTDQSFTWVGKWQTVRLTPEQPYGIWRVRPGL